MDSVFLALLVTAQLNFRSSDERVRQSTLEALVKTRKVIELTQILENKFVPPGLASAGRDLFRSEPMKSLIKNLGISVDDLFDITGVEVKEPAQ